jgi:hypothetical protein
MSKVKFGKDHFRDNEVNLMVNSSIITESDDVLIGQDEFFNQLNKFKDDKSYIKRFEKCDLSDRLGIEMFMFRPNAKLKTALLLTDLTGKLMSTNDIVEATNIAKVIKVGNDLKDSKYKEGDLVMLPLTATAGEAPNPKYYMAHQYDDSNLKPVQNDLIPENVPTFVATMNQMAWLPPQEYKTLDHKIYTYAIYEDLILGHYAY